MSKTIAWVIIIAAVTVIVAMTVCTPAFLSDKNRFLLDFVGPDLLAFLGVVVTITLASAANIHFELNKLEEQAGRAGFPKSRQALRRSAAALLGLLFFTVVLLVAKANLPGGEATQSLVNGAAIVVVICNILVLVDLTQMAFRLKPNIPE